LEQYEPRKAKMLNVCNCFRLKGSLHAAMLEKCLFAYQIAGAKTITPLKK